MSNNETLKDIVAEMRDFRYHETRLKMADRIEAACQREAALLIPAKNIEFFDGNGRRQIASGWVKKGGAR